MFFVFLIEQNEHFKKMPLAHSYTTRRKYLYTIYSLFQAIRMNKKACFVPIVLFFKYFCKYEGIFLSHTRHSTHSATD